MKTIIIIFFCLISFLCYSQDTFYLKVHFLYGSKPLKEFKEAEQKWFGGVLGGHVGIEGDSDRIVNFLPSGRFHLIPKNKNKHSNYAVHSDDNFYAILGGNPDSVKKAVVHIPVTREQKQKFDSISSVYLDQAPYDYALFGMRCGAAAYDILGQIGILTNFNYRKTSRKIFYPKKLRKRLFKKATENAWTIDRQAGSIKRKWEQD